METEKMIRELKRVEEIHKHDKVFTGDLNIAEMAHDVRKRLEELKPYEDTGLTPVQIRELKERDKPKRVVYEHEFEDNRLISYVQRCESCGEAYDPSERFNFCPNCGQRILRRKED